PVPLQLISPWVFAWPNLPSGAASPNFPCYLVVGLNCIYVICRHTIHHSIQLQDSHSLCGKMETETVKELTIS
ncbi:uncharacterized protein BDW43DRAFT_278450, partial [Aspergillus alliaceus]|uniref:uncharacterized protein n=1 Tax=Petromyces alliaceus TaxID=209559 RepID=UPI0012A3F3B1